MFPALSFRQPWAHMIVTGVRTMSGVLYRKDVENRKWSTWFRGDFLVHAAKGMTRDEYLDAIDWCAAELGVGRERDQLCPAFDRLERGGIVGVATLVHVIPPCRGKVVGLFDAVECEHTWHMPEQFGFRLSNVRAVPFTPWRGALGFFGVPREVADPLIARAT
jgi:hypothetical protein